MSRSSRHKQRSNPRRWLPLLIGMGLIVLLGAVSTAAIVMTTPHSPMPQVGQSKPQVSQPKPQIRRGTCSSTSTNFVVGSKTWPNCTNTGVPAGTALKKLISPSPTSVGANTYIEIKQSGTIIKNVELTGSIDVYANNVTIEDSVIKASNWWAINLRTGYHGLRVLHCTLVGLPGQGPDNGYENYGVSSAGSNVEVGWSDISGFGDALSLGSGYIHDNYVHDLQSFMPAGYSYYNHDDDIISNGGSNLTIRHNTLLNQLSPQKGASSALALYDDFGKITKVSVIDNFLAGGSYTLYPAGISSSNIVITGNVFSSLYWPTAGYYGPVDSSYWDIAGAGNKWFENSWADGPRVGRSVEP